MLSGKTKFSDREVESAAEVFYMKLKAAKEYVPEAKYKGDAILIKAADSDMEKTHDYGLGHVIIIFFSLYLP